LGSTRKILAALEPTQNASQQPHANPDATLEECARIVSLPNRHHSLGHHIPGVKLASKLLHSDAGGDKAPSKSTLNGCWPPKLGQHAEVDIQSHRRQPKNILR
jgi:hypothetical protein